MISVKLSALEIMSQLSANATMPAKPIMKARALYSEFSALALLCFCALILTADLRFAAAQATAPVLISEVTSTRAIAFESVTRQHEPFAAVAPIAFGLDKRTRIMLFVMNLQMNPDEGPGALLAEAEDYAHHIYSLPVEYIGPVP